jgi:hypothetical protein
LSIPLTSSPLKRLDVRKWNLFCEYPTHPKRDIYYDSD